MEGDGFSRRLFPFSASRQSARRRHLLQSFTQPFDLSLRPIPAIGDHAGNRPRVGNVVERIRAQDHEIRNAPFLNTSVIRQLPEEAGRIDRRGLQCLERRKPRRDKPLQLEMQADAWRHVDASRRIGPCEKRHAGRVQPADDIEFVIDKSPPDRQRVGGETLEDRLLRRGISRLDPCARRIGDVRILRLVDDVDQPLTALPE